MKPLDIQTSSTITSIVLRAALIWLFSLVLAIPEAVFSDLHTFSINSTNETFVTCAPYPHAGELHPKIHSMAFFLIFYVIPLLAISVYYTFIARSLMRSASDLPVEGNMHARRQASHKKFYYLLLFLYYTRILSPTTCLHFSMIFHFSLHNQQAASRKRLAKTVLVFVGLFAVCWLPSHVLYLYRSYHYSQVEIKTKQNSTVFAVSYYFSYSDYLHVLPVCDLPVFVSLFISFPSLALSLSLL